MITGNQEKTFPTMDFAQSSHVDQDVEEQRLSLSQNTDDIVQVSCSGQSDVAGSYLYGSVAKEVSDAFACAEKFRSYLSSFYQTLSSSHNTSIPHSSPAQDNLLDPSVALRKPSLMVPDQPNGLSITQDVTNMEIDDLDDDVQIMDNDKNLHESSAEYRRDRGGQSGDGDSTACRKASEYMPLVIIDSDDDEDIVIYKCSYRIGGGDSVTCGNAPDHVPVVIIDSDVDEDKVIYEFSDQIGGDDSVTCANASFCEPGVIIDSSKDKDMITTRGVSTTEDQACNIKEHLGCIKHSSVGLVLSEASIFPSDTRDFCSLDRCDEFENGNPDNSITIPPVQISNREDTCVDNEKVLTHSSCASPIRVYEKIGTKETNQQTFNQHPEDVLTKTGDEKSFQIFPSVNCWNGEGNMEEDETHYGGSETESELSTKIGLDENTRLKSYGSMGTECLNLENNNLDDLEKDGLNDIWREMAMAIEYSKTAVADSSLVQQCLVHDCEHSSILLEDMGCVCRICGLIQKSIDTIFDYQWMKGTRTTRTYTSEYRTTKHANSTEINDLFEQNLFSAEVTVHPRHMKKMKPHQLEGFNFLVRNLVTDKPGGCILAHAPGSGKTFMIISFIQSFLAKYPYARPLVVLPKGIIPTWKKEFQRWQVEDIPLYDFYTSKAGNRHQQLDVLKSWIEQKSILFLGYKQLSNIIYDSANTKIAAACQEMLLKAPGLLILDEGHTPRNENTDVFQSLRRVQTPRKVVLSGTLFQNHVSEVFNILDLVHPKFLELDSSRAIIRRVMSRLPISSRRQSRTNYTPFYDSVEEMLRSGDDLKRKVTVIHDLREMTNGILHYYKGDFLDELPGLIDFTVLLNLSSKQKDTIRTLKKLEKFKRTSVENAIYVHPRLKEISENVMGKGGDIFDEDKIHRLLDKLDMQDGVKTKFVLNILDLCESSGEKLLVFSMYLLPLKFLERMLVKEKGWSPGKEIFLISGDSSPEQREWSMEKFNHSPDSKVLFGSIKACGEGISLVGASRVVILDVHLNPSVTRQAIGRAFRPGQLKKVFTYRLVAADSLEEEDHCVALKKELVSKMWFEWSDFCNHRDYEMDAIDLKNCEDIFLESPVLGQDVKVLYRR